LNLLKAKSPLHILTPFQARVLQDLVQEPLLKDFYLTGGTALSAFYLQHRLSDDLDFFTEAPQAVSRIPPVVRKIAKTLKARVAWGRRFETLFECTLARGGERLEMDFALDMPGRLKPLGQYRPLKMALDNSLDISCNKLSALYERSEAKDFVDVFFIHHRYMALTQLIRQAHHKYPELDDYGLAMAFFKVKGISMLPRLIRPLSIASLRAFFLAHARRLAKGFSGS